ncbi:MAG TPA: fumarylacetoacetate hydrolase family protein, partial [Bacteroidales bacterium]|nr:fumarylacetoacetate hydrolase family protein [Bacteroidales bacterium]
ELKLNGMTVQFGNSRDMIFDIRRIIGHVSKYVTLRTGDLIFTGTPKGVGPVQKGDILEGFLEGISSIKVQVK